METSVLRQEIEQFLDDRVQTSHEQVKALAEALHTDPFDALKAYKDVVDRITSQNQGVLPQHTVDQLTRTWSQEIADKTIEKLHDIQDIRDLKVSPLDHFELLFEVVDDYFSHSGLLTVGYTSRAISEKMKVITIKYQSATSIEHAIDNAKSCAADLVRWFNENFWEWERIRIAFCNGIVTEDETTFHYWKKTGSKIPFQWGKFTWEKFNTKLPPIERALYRELELDAI